MLTALRNSTTEPQKGIKTFRGGCPNKGDDIDSTDQELNEDFSHGAAAASASSTAGSLASYSVCFEEICQK